MRGRRLAGASGPTSSIRFRNGSGARRTGAARFSRPSRSRSRRIRGSTTMRVSTGCSGRIRPRARGCSTARRACCVAAIGLDRSGVISRARAFEAKPVGDRAGVSALDEIEDRTGEPAARFEVARRVFWTAFGDACEREGVARGWADAAIAAADHDYVMLERVGRAAFSDVPLAVRDCDRVLDVAVERTWGAVRRSGAVERSVADVVADRLLSNVGVAGPRMDLDQRDSPRVRDMLDRLAAAARPADAVLAKVAPGFAVGGDRDDATVLEVVRERSEAVTEFILDPTRARRSDRVGDVAHSRSAEPWGIWSAPVRGGPAAWSGRGRGNATRVAIALCSRPASRSGPGTDGRRGHTRATCARCRSGSQGTRRRPRRRRVRGLRAPALPLRGRLRDRVWW